MSIVATGRIMPQSSTDLFWESNDKELIPCSWVETLSLLSYKLGWDVSTTSILSFSSSERIVTWLTAEIFLDSGVSIVSFSSSERMVTWLSTESCRNSIGSGLFSFRVLLGFLTRLPFLSSTMSLDEEKVALKMASAMTVLFPSLLLSQQITLKRTSRDLLKDRI